jgi:hypothetical protein
MSDAPQTGRYPIYTITRPSNSPEHREFQVHKETLQNWLREGRLDSKDIILTPEGKIYEGGTLPEDLFPDYNKGPLTVEKREALRNFYASDKKHTNWVTEYHGKNPMDLLKHYEKDWEMPKEVLNYFHDTYDKIESEHSKRIIEANKKATAQNKVERVKDKIAINRMGWANDRTERFAVPIEGTETAETTVRPQTIGRPYELAPTQRGELAIPESNPITRTGQMIPYENAVGPKGPVSFYNGPTTGHYKQPLVTASGLVGASNALYALTVPNQLYNQYKAVTGGYGNSTWDKEYGASDPLALRALFDLSDGTFQQTIKNPEYAMRNPLGATAYGLATGNMEYPKAFMDAYVPNFLK